MKIPGYRKILLVTHATSNLGNWLNLNMVLYLELFDKSETSKSVLKIKNVTKGRYKCSEDEKDIIRLIFLHNIVIPRNEESPLEARQRLGILIAELLEEIPRSSE